MRITTNKVRQRLEAEIATRFNRPSFRLLDETWDQLEELEYDKDPIELQVQTVETWYRQVGQPLSEPEPAGKMITRRQRSSDKKRSPNIPLRQEAISIVFAHDAGLDDDVVRFRNDVLGGSLLEPERVETWIHQRAEKDGPARGTTWLEFPVPAGHRIEFSENGFVISPPLTISKRRPVVSGVQKVKSLSYSMPGDRYMRHKLVSFGGVLDRLRKISKNLARRFQWDEAQATLFTLTGLIPRVEPLRVSISGPVTRRPTALNRIQLIVDPCMSPTDVAEQYQKVRQRTLGVERHRNLEEKHLHLAIFAVERPEGESLKDSMRKWNEVCHKDGHREWKYKPRQLTNFGRDLKRDLRRLLGLERNLAMTGRIRKRGSSGF